jgi:hypothetical protein
MNLPLKVAATQPCEAEAETVCARRRETSLLDRRAAGRTLTRCRSCSWIPTTAVRAFMTAAPRARRLSFDRPRSRDGALFDS